MNPATRSYVNWYTKTVKNLGFTKGFEAKCLLSRFEAMACPETDLQGIHHSQQLYHLFEEYAAEKTGIRWLNKLVEALGVWKQTLEATAQHSNDISSDLVIDSLVSRRSSVDDAIDLLQIAQQ